MVKIFRSATTVFAFTFLAACSASSSGPAATPEPMPEEMETESADPTTADGIFTLAQADRGEALFRSTCSECHDSADWTETGFRGRWEDSQSTSYGITSTRGCHTTIRGAYRAKRRLTF